MRKLFGGVFALALLTCALVPQIAHADRVINYPGENPASTDQNQKDRYVREAFGTFAMQLLGLTASGAGAYGGLTVNPQTSMNVEVDVPSGAFGILLQVAQADSVIPSSVSPQLAADTTNVMVPYVQKSNSGGLSVPAPGSNSIYYLIEAQGQTVDTNNATRLFVDSSGNRYNANVNTVRADQITYQVKAGTAAASPSPPPADTGWVGVATVLVPTGATNCSASCTIVQTTNTVAAAVASSCAACVLTNSNAQLATLGLDGTSAPAHGINGGSGSVPLTLQSQSSGAAESPFYASAANCGGSYYLELRLAGVTQGFVDCAGGYHVVTVGGTNNLTSSGAVVTTATDAALAGNGASLVCASNAGLLQLCAPGGVGTNFPAHGTVVLINSTDGCGSVTATYCATFSSGCSQASDCGHVTITSAAAAGACTDPLLANYAVPGQGDTTPSGSGWMAIPQANNSTGHFEVHFFNFTGGSFGATAGNALAAGFNCVI